MSVSTIAPVRNGIDTAQLYGTLDAVSAEPSLAHFEFRVANEWLGGAHNRSSIKSFYGAGQEDATRETTFTIDAGEPAILLGTDTGPNPAEALLHALAACLTTSIVYVAAARKVELTKVESKLEGDIDARGMLGLDDKVRNGFDQVRVTFHIEGNAPPEKLEEIVQRAQSRSVVFDSLTRGISVALEAKTASA